MFNITDKGINLLINSIEQQENKYFWVRSPDVCEQIYISECFESVWGQENAKLFEHPMSFMDALIQEENQDILHLYEQRASGSKEQREQTILARIKSSNDQDIVHFRDTCFCICDTYGNVVGVAGIGEVINESEWYYDLEGKVNESSPLDLLKQSQHARYIVSDKPKLAEPFEVDIPSKRVKAHYYVMTQTGEIALTLRELESVYCLLAGMTAKQTARHLKISPRTVEEYLNKVRDKLGCQNKLEIAKHIKHIVR